MHIAASSGLSACQSPIFPSAIMSLPHQIPIVRIDPRDGEREVVMARWGLIPFWMKEKPKVPHINARAETVHKLPLFFARHSLTAMSHSRDGVLRVAKARRW